MSNSYLGTLLTLIKYIQQVIPRKQERKTQKVNENNSKNNYLVSMTLYVCSVENPILQKNVLAARS